MYYPIKFKPVYKNYIWGGRYFEKFDRELPEGILAESWELSCHKNGVSMVANGELIGSSLPDIVKVDPQNVLGTRFPADCQEVPLLIKFIDANDKLSVQVHPDDNFAAVYEGGLGKNEVWYIMDAKPGAKLIAGLKPGVTREVFAQCIRDNRMEECLLEVEVQRGDVVYIPAGRIHAIGAGIVLTEIQQTSDTTYRVYDYNRLDGNGTVRPLHQDKALNVTDFSAGRGDVKIKGIKHKINENCTKTIFIANRFFACEKYEAKGNFTESTDGSKFFILICIEGSGTIRSDSMTVEFKAGETVFIPASLGEYKLEGTFTSIKTYIPDFRKDIVEPMRNAGCADNDIFYVLSR